jgi:rhodanese-related sulfurtransferase
MVSFLGIIKKALKRDDEQARVAAQTAEKAWAAQLDSSVVLRNLPKASVTAIQARLVPLEVKAKQVVVREGDQGDAFYLIVSGRARVWRKGDASGPVELAVLNGGDSFGEEALISRGVRNATVEMATDGLVLRLNKDDFDSLIKAPKLVWFSAVDTVKRLRQGACLLDVRPAAEFVAGALYGAVSLPLSELRERVKSLDPQRLYICCCRTGRLSATAAFLLGQRGIHVGILRGGLQRLPGFSGDERAPGGQQTGSRRPEPAGV